MLKSGMPAFLYIVLFVGSVTSLGLLGHHQMHGLILQPMHTLLSLFFAVNLLITLWEIALSLYPSHIRSEFLSLKKNLARGELPSFYFVEKATIAQVFSFKFWTKTWSTYAIFDDSYGDKKSFGWNADVANGWLTPLPSILFTVGTTLPDGGLGLSPRIIGFIGALVFWQALYGTLVYFFQWVNNSRWQEHGMTPKMSILFVFLPNVFWIVFPALGLYACYDMVTSNSIRVFL